MRVEDHGPGLIYRETPELERQLCRSPSLILLRLATNNANHVEKVLGDTFQSMVNTLDSSDCESNNGRLEDQEFKGRAFYTP